MKSHEQPDLFTKSAFYYLDVIKISMSNIHRMNEDLRAGRVNDTFYKDLIDEIKDINTAVDEWLKYVRFQSINWPSSDTVQGTLDKALNIYMKVAFTSNNKDTRYQIRRLDLTLRVAADRAWVKDLNRRIQTGEELDYPY